MLGCGHQQQTTVFPSHRTFLWEMFLPPAAACSIRHSLNFSVKHPWGVFSLYGAMQMFQFITIINTDAMKTLVNAFITSLVDHCNSMLMASGAIHLCPMQSILNASACLIVKKIISWQQFEMNCTGNQCSNDLSIKHATSSTSAFIKVHHHIYHLCLFVLAKFTVDVIVLRQQLGNLVIPHKLNTHLDHADSLCLVSQSGTHIHWWLEILIT